MGDRTRTRASARLTFLAGNRSIRIRRSEKRFSVEVVTPHWTIRRNGLAEATAVSLALLGVRARKSTLTGPVKLVKVAILLEQGIAKTTGVNWIALRMAGGARPIMLKAPGLFRHCLLYIEPIAGTEGRFTMRVIDPYTDRRTEPVEVGHSEVESAVATFPRV